MEVVEIDFSDKHLVQRYNRLFEECPNAFIQQSTYWCDVIKDIGPDKPIFLLYNESGKDIAGLPLYLYENNFGNVLISTPYPGSLGGIFHTEDVTRNQIDNIYKYLLLKSVSVSNKYNCIALTIITNPFNNDVDLYEKHLSPNFVFENFTQYIPLTQSVHRSHGHRNNLNKAKKSGCSINICADSEELKIWYNIHRKRHIEAGAMPLDYRLFENIFKYLMKKDKAQIFFVKYLGEIISGGFYIYHHKVLDVCMISMDSQYENFAPNFVNTDHSIQWAKERGLEIYNWQSSQNKSCGVYSYKKQWGSEDKPYYFVTKIFCQPQIIQERGLNTIRQAYPWHYVVPFEIFTRGFMQKYFKK